MTLDLSGATVTLYFDAASWATLQTVRPKVLVLGPRLAHTGVLRHGTASGYQVHKCRCPDCRQWNRDTMRRLRARWNAA